MPKASDPSKLPPAEWLRERLHYNPDTGVIIWSKPDCTRIKPGEIAGAPHSNGYWKISSKWNGKVFQMLAHRLAWAMHHGVWPDPAKTIDHINGDRKDNRIVNLRLATIAENARNQKISKANKSGFKGVYYEPIARRWRAMIRHGGRQHCLGLFKDKSKAYQAYVAAAKRHHLGFANDGISPLDGHSA